jgi:tripartite ATP-independent transporter DctM subunit
VIAQPDDLVRESIDAVQGLEIERRPKRRFETVDRAIGWITEIPAAILVLVEVLVLFAGVVARYVFDKPLIWSDELAQTLFLWLVMFGSTIALRRSEHMRMTALVSRLSPRVQRWFSTMALVVVAIVLLFLLPNARDYMVTQYAILTPALHMHDAYRVLGMVVGIVLMLLIVVLRLAEESDWKPIAGSLAIAAVVGVAMALAHPFFVSIGAASLAIFFLGLVGLCVAAGVPIAFCFAIATMTYLTFAAPTTLSVVVGQMDQGMTPLELLAVPMFVLLGLLLEMAGIAGVLVNFLAQLVGRLRGGLSYVLLGAMFLISGISGSKAADQAAVAPVLFPEMKKRGAHPGELVAQLAASAAMSETIPPSLVLIIIASVTGVSISALFTGGIMPAFVAGLALVVVVFLRSRHEARGVGPAPTAKQIGKAFLVAIPGLILPLLVRFFVLDGIATATEVSTIGIIYSVVVGLFVYRRFKWARVFPILIDTAALSGAILLIIGSATAMAWALTQAGFAQALATTMAGVPGGAGGFLAISIVAFIVLGSVLEGIPAIVLFGPLLFPIARDMHINEVHYTMVVILAMGVGLFSPPFGVGFYQSVLIGRSTSEEAIGRIFPYLASIVVALILVAAIPWLSTGLLH